MPSIFNIASLSASTLSFDLGLGAQRPVSFSIGRCLMAMVLPFCFIGCSPIKHDEELAKKRALEFAEVAFVRQNVEQGYARLSDEAKRHVTLEKFRETLSRLHPDGHPTRVSVTGYKPMFNEKMIYVFLSGESSGRQFQYMLTLEGTAASDYKVAVVTRTS